MAPRHRLHGELPFQVLQNRGPGEHQVGGVRRQGPHAGLPFRQIGKRLAVDAEVIAVVRAAIGTTELAEPANIQLELRELLLREARRGLDRFLDRGNVHDHR